MEFPQHFICASHEFSTLEHRVPAPLLRRSFTLDKTAAKAELVLCGLGLYDLYVNGQRVSKGALPPYISNPDDLLYYDVYDVAHLLRRGENVIGVVLGNGMKNAFGGWVWDFDKAKFRGEPCLALRLTVTGRRRGQTVVESDRNFLTHPSAILSDDLRLGESYDARLESAGWNAPGFIPHGWKRALTAPVPRGEAALCTADPVVAQKEMAPAAITRQPDGFLYDFGENTTGVCRLSIEGKPGQRVEMTFGEILNDGRLDLSNINFGKPEYMQRDVYVCGVAGRAAWMPRFTYHGFRYVLVTGVTEAQATKELLTCVAMHSALRERGGFTCSDPTAARVQELARRSTLTNFVYFPTDCPHREKNGWTGDASVSAEHTLLNLEPERSYREWLRNIRAAMDERGALPGIVPTGGWGFRWGNGPAWDAVLTYLPYFTYVYRGDTEILRENATAILRYLNYLATRVRADGLIAIGLGDWCQAGRGGGDCIAPLEFTDTVVSMNICKKASLIFDVLGMPLQKQFADGLHAQLRAAARARLIDFGTMTAAGNCQTAQAMAIFYHVFEAGETPAAMRILLRQISEAGGHMDTGMLGSRVIFHVLAAAGEGDLAFDMITRPDFPSYGNWVARGATTLWEDFLPESAHPNSQNHHFFGDISHWFIRWAAGIHLNPHEKDVSELLVAPLFLGKLQWAKGFHEAPAGKIETAWRRVEGGVELTVSAPEQMHGALRTPLGFEFEDGCREKPLSSGTFLCRPAGGRK